ncbi:MULTISPECIES: DUF6191 domain-containing protein [Streptomyces]|uniref:DUF6191 domain-containing protein n=1 Tax=Streptomyces TaxID=1883 RepID=UPI00206D580C|nr:MULTISPECIES: DUF6191 domain-containing protein [Streptomyces]UPT44863.1 DUF6191 domain-containing protein [Streptomyces sp. WAC00303]WIY79023.1 DUF6191 domain-containing protein [Streptomyces anulatus]
MFNFFEELFAPGRKHVSDEQKRLELSRVDLGIGDPNRGPIDLTSGKVTVRVPAPDAAPEQDAVLDRPRPGKPAGGPERRADEEPGT